MLCDPPSLLHSDLFLCKTFSKAWRLSIALRSCSLQEISSRFLSTACISGWNDRIHRDISLWGWRRSLVDNDSVRQRQLCIILLCLTYVSASRSHA
ncbi:unnamed protein product [Somion occarium]|uniref:Uncharacterized protein n=1 Tax=Somion occarium TaxID=3059160 RepID=A0ABP1DAQ1_9APHY